MTKAQAMEIKKVIGATYKTYFQSKSGTMSVRVYSYINSSYNHDEETAKIEKLTKMIEQFSVPFAVKKRTYQGFIHDTDIIIG